MKLTNDEYKIKDMFKYNNNFIVWQTKLHIKNAILKDISQDLSKWHIPFTECTKLYSDIFNALDSALKDIAYEYRQS